MADSYEEDIFDAFISCSSLPQMALSASVLIACAVLLKQPAKRVHCVWIRKYLAGRSHYGAYNSLMNDLLERDSTKFRNHIWMVVSCQNVLSIFAMFILISDVIKNRDGTGWDISRSLRQIVAKLHLRALP
jgi:hypothetical protein